MFGGITVKGGGIGRQLGYPTANLDCRSKEVKLKEGIYAAHAKLDNQTYKAGLVIRFLPFKVEVYLIDYKGDDFYGSYLEVIPVQKVAELEHYESVEELRDKIENDMKVVAQVFS